MASISDVPPDVSRASMVLVPTVLTTIIALIMTILRLYVRIFMVKLFGWDDFFNVLACITMLVVMGLVCAATQNGLGRHVMYVASTVSTSVKLLRIAEFVVILLTIFVKISISLFLKRLFPTSRAWAVFFWSFIAFNSITSLVDALVIFPQCKPVELNWDKSVVGTCWSDEAINALGITQGTIAAFTDFILAILPFFFLWGIQMSWKIKLGVCSIMSLGFASGGFAIARTILVPSLTATHDPSWDLVPLFMWAVLEGTFGVIAAAAPCVRPLLGHNSASRDYSNSQMNHTRSLPLQSMRAGHESQYQLKDRGDSKDAKLWGGGDGRILKTTDVRIDVDSMSSTTAVAKSGRYSEESEDKLILQVI